MDWTNTFSKEHLPCFLVGSGISLDPPSHLPTGPEFTHFLISHLICGVDQSAIRSLTTPSASRAHLRFEWLMEEVRRWDPDLQILAPFDAFSHPNANHKWLASLALMGAPLFTTNFDSLLEAGLRELGCPIERIAPIILKEDWEKPVLSSETAVHKLHGSLRNLRSGADTRASVQATLRQIANGKATVFELESWKRSVFAKALENHDLVVLGYSGLDDFDILPTIRHVKSTRRVIWVDHDPQVPLDEATMEPIPSGPPEGAESVLERTLRSFLDGARPAATVYRVRTATGPFLRALHDHLHPTPPTISESTGGSPAEIKLPSSLNLSEAEKALLAGLLFSYSDTNRAEASIRHGLELADQNARVGRWSYWLQTAPQRPHRGRLHVGATDTTTPASSNRTSRTNIRVMPRSFRNTVVTRMGAFSFLLSWLTHKKDGPQRTSLHYLSSQGRGEPVVRRRLAGAEGPSQRRERRPRRLSTGSPWPITSRKPPTETDGEPKYSTGVYQRIMMADPTLLTAALTALLLVKVLFRRTLQIRDLTNGISYSSFGDESQVDETEARLGRCYVAQTSETHRQGPEALASRLVELPMSSHTLNLYGIVAVHAYIVDVSEDGQPR